MQHTQYADTFQYSVGSSFPRAPWAAVFVQRHTWRLRKVLAAKAMAVSAMRLQAATRLQATFRGARLRVVLAARAMAGLAASRLALAGGCARHGASAARVQGARGRLARRLARRVRRAIVSV